MSWPPHALIVEKSWLRHCFIHACTWTVVRIIFMNDVLSVLHIRQLWRDVCRIQTKHSKETTFYNVIKVVIAESTGSWRNRLYITYYIIHNISGKKVLTDLADGLKASNFVSNKHILYWTLQLHFQTILRRPGLSNRLTRQWPSFFP